MTRALLLSFSPHGKAAQTFRLARALLREQAPEAEVVERDYGGQGLPALTREYANALTTPGGLSGPATERSEQLIVELEACDLLIICTPCTISRCRRPSSAGSTMWCASTAVSR